MKKFMVLYHAPADAVMETSNTSPEDQAKGMEEWNKWAKKCGDRLVDFGNPLGNGQAITSNGSKPSQKGVAGYSVIQAESMDEAKKLLKDHPHLGWHEGCEIEVHESFEVPGM